MITSIVAVALVEGVVVATAAAAATVVASAKGTEFGSMNPLWSDTCSCKVSKIMTLLS